MGNGRCELMFAVGLQVEFYFSDSNLPGDQFLLKSIEESGDDCILILNFDSWDA